jgi:hypothetical protein
MLFVVGVLALNYCESQFSGPGYINCVGASAVMRPQATAGGLTFSRRLGPDQSESTQSFTDPFDAPSPWTLTWTTDADAIRIDLFDARASVPYGPFVSTIDRNAAGHVLSIDSPIAGSRPVAQSGLFCLTVSVADRSFRGLGTYPPRRPMSWTVTIRSD